MSFIDAALEAAAAEARKKTKESPRTFSPGVWNYVSSSNVRAFKYDPDTRKLSVQFLSGREYEYFNIDQEMVESFSTAGSPGGWVWANIRGLPAQRVA